MPDHAKEAEEYTIDELATASRVPSRTIRFYQSTGALPKPTVRGRVAYYNARHLQRLELVASLQDRGLRMKAICELLHKIDAGQLNLHEWLGLEEQIGAPWSEDRPLLMTREELHRLIEEDRPGLISDLARLRLVERQGEQFKVRSPGLLRITLQLEASGVDLDTAYEAAAIMRKHVTRASKELAKYFVKRASVGFGHDANADELMEAFRAVRPLGQEALRLIFSQEMEKAMRELLSTGPTRILPKGRNQKV
ncbi:MAG: MerR family transcriptional regulator [Myxococcota bacterium]